MVVVGFSSGLLIWTSVFFHELQDLFTTVRGLNASPSNLSTDDEYCYGQPKVNRAMATATVNPFVAQMLLATLPT